MKDKLEFTLSLVIGWLKFAEGKNATLVAANGAAIFWLLNLYGNDMPSDMKFVVYIYQAIILLFLSASFCLISFIPQVSVPWLMARGEPKNKDNLLAYSDIAKYDPDYYLESVYKQSDNNVTSADPYERHLSELIVLYSRIAMRKYSLFNAGVWFSLSAIVTPLGAVLVLIIKKVFSK